MAKSKIIRISSVLPAAPEKIWPLLTRVETLQYIAAPFAAFSPVSPTNETVWREGETMRFKLRVFGFIPFGFHTIRVVRFDQQTYTVQTYESNKSVPVWNHRITLEPAGTNTTLYTDEVEIGADWLTGIVYLWSAMFYLHRQRKWKRLLADSERRRISSSAEQ